MEETLGRGLDKLPPALPITYVIHGPKNTSKANSVTYYQPLELLALVQEVL